MVGSQSEDGEAGVAAGEVVDIQVNFKRLHSLFKSSIRIPQFSYRGAEMDLPVPKSSHYYLLLDINRTCPFSSLLAGTPTQNIKILPSSSWKSATCPPLGLPSSRSPGKPTQPRWTKSIGREGLTSRPGQPVSTKAISAEPPNSKPSSPPSPNSSPARTKCRRNLQAGESIPNHKRDSSRDGK